MDETLNDPKQALASTLAADLRALVRQLKRRFREQGNAGDLTPSQMSVLVRLEADGPATMSALARAEGIRPQSMGTIVASLEAAGHIAGVPDPNDGRQTILSLTDACREWIARGRAARQDWLHHTIEARLDPGEQARLAAAVDLLKRLVD